MASRSYILEIMRIIHGNASFGASFTTKEIYDRLLQKRGTILLPPTFFPSTPDSVAGETNEDMLPAFNLLDGVLNEFAELGLVEHSNVDIENEVAQRSWRCGGFGRDFFQSHDGTEISARNGVREILAHRYIFCAPKPVFYDAISRALELVPNE